jgi:hypothetical protein
MRALQPATHPGARARAHPAAAQLGGRLRGTQPQPSAIVALRSLSQASERLEFRADAQQQAPQASRHVVRDRHGVVASMVRAAAKYPAPNPHAGTTEKQKG